MIIKALENTKFFSTIISSMTNHWLKSMLYCETQPLGSNHLGFTCCTSCWDFDPTVEMEQREDNRFSFLREVVVISANCLVYQTSGPGHQGKLRHLTISLANWDMVLLSPCASYLLLCLSYPPHVPHAGSIQCGEGINYCPNYSAASNWEMHFRIPP